MRRHCLIPARSFWEWPRIGGKKRRYRIGLREAALFAFAGLWETWRSPQGTEIPTFTIITCPANSLLTPLHERMPVIFEQDYYDRWLHTEPVNGLALLQPLDSHRMYAQPGEPESIVNTGHGEQITVEPESS